MYKLISHVYLHEWWLK